MVESSSRRQGRKRVAFNQIRRIHLCDNLRPARRVVASCSRCVTSTARVGGGAAVRVAVGSAVTCSRGGCVGVCGCRSAHGRRTTSPRSTRVPAEGLSFGPALRKFFRLVQGAAVEWIRVLEFRMGNAHAHALLRGRVTRRLLRRARRSSGLRVSAQRVRNVMGVAAYFWKHTGRTDRKAELAPATFRGRLYSCSRGFLSAPCAELWKAVKTELATRKEPHG